ncbi:hypothetical protein BVY04_03310 [bacterium M21]|nr:hypothetical protein BVY04_03310 [bacterium M21]
MDKAVQIDMTLTMPEFQLYQALMYKLAGVRLSDRKHALVQARLKKRIHHLGLPSYHAYYKFIQQPEHADERQECLNALTTNETFFFRHKIHWDYVLKNIVPELKHEHQFGGTVRIWSAACSSGEEPYSVAIGLYDALCSDQRWKIHVDATDINKQVLTAAQAAVYDTYATQKITKLCLKKYFDCDASRQRFTVKEIIRKQVSFYPHNLLEPRTGPRYEIIFLRNVMIYFDGKSKKQVLSNVISRLKPGGYLFLGGAETLPAFHEQFTYIKPTIYRKVDK